MFTGRYFCNKCIDNNKDRKPKRDIIAREKRKLEEAIAAYNVLVPDREAVLTQDFPIWPWDSGKCIFMDLSIAFYIYYVFNCFFILLFEIVYNSVFKSLLYPLSFCLLSFSVQLLTFIEVCFHYCLRQLRLSLGYSIQRPSWDKEAGLWPRNAAVSTSWRRWDSHQRWGTTAVTWQDLWKVSKERSCR